ncbi:hypothetical protein L596_005636 [Steinernema carpocapsae]|uniref:SLC41A/MgtE integral membrane domain-containing protein n=1 Tax=Steinernema carpocapsae TaxID=34508 RepID=A0A4U8V0W0_STECR|nr:hypothetical protein L596_005636 [Steinernema carpocapsae]
MASPELPSPEAVPAADLSAKLPQDEMLLRFETLQGLSEHPSTNSFIERKLESTSKFTKELIPSLLVAVVGLIMAGFVLQWVSGKTFFKALTDAVTVVPVLAGLKGNIEMTMASRLTSAAAAGTLSVRTIRSNVGLAVVQGFGVSTVAAVFLFFAQQMQNPAATFEDFLFLVVVMVTTATIASFVMGIMVSCSVFLCMTNDKSPDAIVIPLAATIGDIGSIALFISLLLMVSVLQSGVGTALLPFRTHVYLLTLAVFIAMLLNVIVGATFALQNEKTKHAFKWGWIPILSATAIGVGAGVFLHATTEGNLERFQPVLNGIGGNLAAILSSRIATELHCDSLDETSYTKPSWRSIASSFVPRNMFSWSPDADHSTVATILLILALPLFVLSFEILDYSHVLEMTIRYRELVAFCLTGVMQSSLLLWLASGVPLICARMNWCPDSVVIPILTSLGDLFSSAAFFGLVKTLRAL